MVRGNSNTLWVRWRFPRGAPQLTVGIWQQTELVLDWCVPLLAWACPPPFPSCANATLVHYSHQHHPKQHQHWHHSLQLVSTSCMTSAHGRRSLVKCCRQCASPATPPRAPGQEPDIVHPPRCPTCATEMRLCGYRSLSFPQLRQQLVQWPCQ